MRRGFLLGLLGLVALASCSVKEDRSDCPCWLTVIADDGVSVSGWFGSITLFSAHMGRIEDYLVPRGSIELVASYGNFITPVGEQMDRLFAQRQNVNTWGETAKASVELCKNYATVEVDFKDEDDGHTGYDLLVSGTVCGADSRTLEPIEGVFRCVPIPKTGSGERGYEFRVPRQKDKSLILTLSYLGNVVETIDLGYLIAKSGFDWSAESLGDVSIIADIPAMTFLVTIKEWEGPVSFSITI